MTPEAEAVKPMTDAQMLLRIAHATIAADQATISELRMQNSALRARLEKAEAVVEAARNILREAAADAAHVGIVLGGVKSDRPDWLTSSEIELAKTIAALDAADGAVTPGEKGEGG